MKDRLKEIWVPEDYVYSCVSDCLLAHPEQAASLIRGDSALIKERKAREVLIKAIEEEINWFNSKSDCIAELKKAIKQSNEILEIVSEGSE